MILDPRPALGKKPITLKVQGMSFGNAMKWSLRLAGLEYAPMDGAVFISNRAGIAEGPYQHPKNLPIKIREIFGKPVSFDCVETPLGDVVRLLKNLLQFEAIQIDPRIDKKKTLVNLKVFDMPLKHALAWILRMNGLSYRIKGESTIEIIPLEKLKSNAPEEGR